MTDTELLIPAEQEAEQVVIPHVFVYKFADMLLAHKDGSHG